MRSVIRHGLHVELRSRIINRARPGGYLRDHVLSFSEGLGCNEIRVTDPKDAHAPVTTAPAN